VFKRNVKKKMYLEKKRIKKKHRYRQIIETITAKKEEDNINLDDNEKKK
jgi:hypothetical protein